MRHALALVALVSAWLSFAVHARRRLLRRGPGPHVLALAAFLVAGCAVPSTFEPVRCDGVYTASEDFTPAQRAALAHVEARWLAFSGRPLSISIGSSPTCHIRPVEAIDATGQPSTGATARDGSNAGYSTGNVLIAAHLEGRRFENVVLHEVGHGFGMMHTGAGIMNERTGEDFTPEDRAEWERATR